MILECLQIALQAPTGSFSQGWPWMFVEDPDKKRAIADYYGANFDALPRAVPAGRSSPTATSGPSGATPSGRRRTTSASTSTRCPVLLIPLLEGRLDGLPGVRRRQLLGLDPARGVELHAGAARARPRLGVDHAAPPERAEVAELLGIPYDRYTQAGLFPIAYTLGTDFKPAPRLDVGELVHWDTW